MFRVDSDGLRKASEEMEVQIRSLNNAILDVEDVINGLNRLSGMDEVMRVIRQESEKMTNERKSLVQMMTAIREIAEIYEVCENNIVSYAEELRSRETQNFSWNNIPVFPGNVNHVIDQINWA